MLAMVNAVLDISTTQRANQLLREHMDAVHKRCDRLLCGLLGFEWVVGIVVALWRSPRTWNGTESRIHPHVWAAIFLGGAIITGPIVLALLRSGQVLIGKSSSTRAR